MSHVNLEPDQHLKTMHLGGSLWDYVVIVLFVLLGLECLIGGGLVFAGESEACAIGVERESLVDDAHDLRRQLAETVVHVVADTCLEDL